MNRELVNGIVQAVLYEGYILYPYRASAIKNQRERFTFGRVYPERYSQAQNGAEPCLMQTECLARALGEEPRIAVDVRFLQPMWREVGTIQSETSEWNESQEPQMCVLAELKVGERVCQTWQEAVERRVEFAALSPRDVLVKNQPFGFEVTRTFEKIYESSGRMAGVFRRRTEALEGAVEVSFSWINADWFKVSVRIKNVSPIADEDLKNRDAVLTRTIASTHTVLHARGAEFASLLDPPLEVKEAARGLRNIGTWPVLVGDEQKAERDTMLSSPIILYDYPKIAPESRGDLFDSTEIDELLTLRIQTMTDEEKRQMRQVDAQARRLLERAEALPKHELMQMHGALRDLRSLDEQLFGSNRPLEVVSQNGEEIRLGSRVRIQPRARADVMDLALAGKVGIVEAIEEDAEQRIHLALVLEDDPGKDLGFMRQPGHRFFYAVDEVELVADADKQLEAS